MPAVTRLTINSNRKYINNSRLFNIILRSTTLSFIMFILYLVVYAIEDFREYGFSIGNVFLNKNNDYLITFNSINRNPYCLFVLPKNQNH